MKVLLLLLAVLSVEAQRLLSIDTIDAVDLFKAPLNPSNPFDQFGGPLDPPLQRPQSHRIVYRPFNPAVNTAHNIPFTLVSTTTAAQTFQMKLEAPFLEQDPWNCANTAAATTGNCRCNTVAAEQKYPYRHSAVFSQTVPAGTRVVTFPAPNWVYFPHAPYPGQNPYGRTYRKICYMPPGSAIWIDTTVWYAVVKSCTVDANCAAPETSAWFFDAQTSTATALTNDPSWECRNASLLGSFWSLTATTLTLAPKADATLGYDTSSSEYCFEESREQTQERLNRNKCCFLATAATGVCTNSRIYDCCGNKPYDNRYDFCCSESSTNLITNGQDCKCTTGSQCKTGLCCTLTKYDRDITALTAGSPLNIVPELAGWIRSGFCYDGQSTLCCDDGNVYDPTTQKCCPVNGVQSTNVPCPCNIDTDCRTGETCCLQRFPTSWALGQGPHAIVASKLQQCDKFANWPNGQSPAEVQKCYGKCFDATFQTCCNGALCSLEYDRCCNSTCCNRFTSTCLEGSRPGARGFGSRVNPLDYGAAFEICSAIECFTTRKAFWVFVMPVFWLFATLVSLAVVIVIARRATEETFELTEKAMVLFAVIIIFLSMPLFFAPAYKYGIMACFIALFGILAAVLRSTKLSFIAIPLTLVLLIYWLDPFNGNIYLSLTGGLSPATKGTTAWAAGVFLYLSRLVRFPEECTSFYDFFNNDPLAHDFARKFNPNKSTYGYCSRAWLATLVIFTILTVLSILLLLLLSVFSFTKKLVPKSPKGDLTFEVRPEYNY